MNERVQPNEQGIRTLAEYCLMEGAMLLKAYLAFDPERKGLSENSFSAVLFAEAMKMGLTYEQYEDLLKAFKEISISMAEGGTISEPPPEEGGAK